MSNTYNGWKNRATWIVSMYLTDTPEKDRFWNAQTKYFVSAFDRPESVYKLAESIEIGLDSIVESYRHRVCEMLYELIRSATATVDFNEIADCWIYDEEPHDEQEVLRS